MSGQDRPLQRRCPICDKLTDGVFSLAGHLEQQHQKELHYRNSKFLCPCGTWLNTVSLPYHLMDAEEDDGSAYLHFASNALGTSKQARRTAFPGGSTRREGEQMIDKDHVVKRGTTVCPLCDTKHQGFLGLARHLTLHHGSIFHCDYLDLTVCACGTSTIGIVEFANHLAAHCDPNGRIHAHVLAGALGVPYKRS